jgi:hypothetical protein
MKRGRDVGPSVAAKPALRSRQCGADDLRGVRGRREDSRVAADANRRALLGLAALVAIAIAVWLLFARAREAREAQSRVIEDDLEMLARIVDASAIPALPDDRLALGSAGAYVLLAAAGVIESVP